MSMVRELISAISLAEQQIDDQISKLNSYKSEIEQVHKRVDNAFGGTQTEYGPKMLEQLLVTKRQVEETIERLIKAKEKLSLVKMI